MSRHQFPLDFSLWSELTDGRFDKNIQTWYISMIYDIYITVCRFREKLPAKQLRCVSKWNWFHNKWITLKSVIYQNQLGVFVELGFLMVLYFWPAGELRCRIALITSPAFAWEMSKKKKKKAFTDWCWRDQNAQRPCSCSSLSLSSSKHSLPLHTSCPRFFPHSFFSLFRTRTG